MTEEASIRPRTRIRIEPDTGTVAKGALLVADEVLAARAEFIIDRIGWVQAGAEGTHETILLAAARSVTAVGGDRRRGSGWVTVTPVEPAWTGAHCARPPPWPGPPIRPRLPGRARAVPVTGRGSLRVTVTARQRLALGVGSEVSYFTGTHPFAPGSVLRGALAAAWIAENGPPTSGGGAAAFRELFDGPIRYGPMFVPGTVVVPVSARRCKYPAMRAASPRRWTRRSRRECCPACGGRWSPARDRSSCPAMSPWSGSPAPRSTRRRPRPPTGSCTRTARSRPGRAWQATSTAVTRGWKAPGGCAWGAAGR